MNFDLYKGSLDFFEFDIKKGELKYDEKKKRYEVLGECKEKKEGKSYYAKGFTGFYIKRINVR